MSLESLFEQYTGAAPASSVALTGSASHRRYYRLTGADGRTLIGVEGTDAVGTTVLYDALAAGRASGNYGPDEVALLRKTLAALPKIQVEGARGLDFSVCYPQPSFDARMVDFDLNYFKYDFLKLVGVEFNEVFLQDDFDRLKADLLAEPSDTFLYRDFNARNVMLVDGEPWFIDFQGGRRGPVYYDVASFLWQARAKYPEALREELLQVYLDALKAYLPVDEAHFRQRLRLFILFRMLQVLGCYGYRGLWEGNKAFSSSIPPALAIVKSLLPFNDYPYLSEVLSNLCRGALSPEGVFFPKPSAIKDCSVPQDCSVPPTASGGPLPLMCPRVGTGLGKNTPSSGSPLTVTVYSFSFRKGIPEDTSGNGGGYVFDCRSVHNPGKYERFKQLTGLDEPVIQFLEEDGEILRFLDHVYALVDAHVERFLERGFTHLQVSFGCTGGQHRSAYSAQHLAEHLVAKYPVKVHLIHRERGIDTWLPSHSSCCD